MRRAGFDRGVPAPVVKAQELRGAQAFHWGWPREFLERVQDPVPKAIYEARLRGFDQAMAARLKKETELTLRYGAGVEVKVKKDA